jgi:hypothetical protein
LSTALLPLTRPSPSLTWASASMTVRSFINPCYMLKFQGNLCIRSCLFRSGGSAPSTCHCEVTTQCVGCSGLANPCINSHSEDRLVACIHQSWEHDPIWVIFTTATSTYLIPVG